MAQHNETGKQGEAAAMQYLQGQGYQILDQNYRHQHAEIDLVAQKDRLLVFVEVKTRTNLSYGEPETFVSYTKANLVMRAADHYIYARDWQHDIRFDVVAVSITPRGEVKINHIEDAFC